MACNCIQTLNTRLAEANANTEISVTFQFEPFSAVFPAIQTKLIEKRRGARPMAAIPTYCPWCGLNYKTGAPAAVKAVPA